MQKITLHTYATILVAMEEGTERISHLRVLFMQGHPSPLLSIKIFFTQYARIWHYSIKIGYAGSFSSKEPSAFSLFDWNTPQTSCHQHQEAPFTQNYPTLTIAALGKFEPLTELIPSLERVSPRCNHICFIRSCRFLIFVKPRNKAT